MHWIYLIAAILSEIAGTISMKYSEGFTKLLPSALLFIFYGAALTFITIALKKIDLSIAYTIWAGVGTTIIAIIGIFFFNEEVTLLKIVSIIFVIIGVAGLKLSSSSY